jgi:hypothetical protein
MDKEEQYIQNKMFKDNKQLYKYMGAKIHRDDDDDDRFTK